MLSSWKSFTDLQKAKYKEMSLQDKERMKVQFGSTIKTKREKTSFDFEKLEARQKLKSKKDLELKLRKREEFKSIKQDVDSSKIILQHMIAEKKESFKTSWG